MTKETICIAYCGKKVDNGSMAVNDLAPALLAFSNLIDQCNKDLNKDNSRVSIYVKSDFQKGSFEINLEIVHALEEQLKMLLSFNQGLSIKEILETIGFVSGLSGCNLMDLVRWVKNRKINSVTTIDNNRVKISIEHEEREFSLGALTLFRSYKARESLEGVLVPLQDEGMDAFAVINKQTNEVIQRINKEEREYFNAPKEDIVASEIVSNRQAFVKILSVNFEEDLKWRFEDGTYKFYATIEDREFIRRIELGETSFNKGDVLMVELETIQTMEDSINIKSIYSIKKVLEHIKRPEQMPLPFYD